jgi:uncharacterized caspase-like protein
MRMFGILLRVLALTATLTLAQAQAPAPRAALVIGNADYSFGALRNPKNDAEAMAKALDEAGFDVTVATDVGAHGLSRIDSNASLFVSYATSPGAVALDGAGHNSPSSVP